MVLAQVDSMKLYLRTLCVLKTSQRHGCLQITPVRKTNAALAGGGNLHMLINRLYAAGWLSCCSRGLTRGSGGKVAATGATLMAQEAGVSDAHAFHRERIPWSLPEANMTRLKDPWLHFVWGLCRKSWRAYYHICIHPVTDAQSAVWQGLHVASHCVRVLTDNHPSSGPLEQQA